MLGAIAFFSPYLGGPSLISGRETDNSLPKTSYTAGETKETLQKTVATPGEAAPSVETNSVNAPGAAKPSAHSDPSKCERLTGKLMDAYNDQVKEEKNALDDILSYLPTLVSGGEKHVGDYNAKITALYTKQAEAAAAENCTLPIGGPELLPGTYSPN